MPVNAPDDVLCQCCLELGLQAALYKFNETSNSHRSRTVTEVHERFLTFIRWDHGQVTQVNLQAVVQRPQNLTAIISKRNQDSN